jgi:hypothetical protein
MPDTTEDRKLKTGISTAASLVGRQRACGSRLERDLDERDRCLDDPCDVAFTGSVLENDERSWPESAHLAGRAFDLEGPREDDGEVSPRSDVPGLRLEVRPWIDRAKRDAQSIEPLRLGDSSADFTR